MHAYYLPRDKPKEPLLRRPTQIHPQAGSHEP